MHKDVSKTRFSRVSASSLLRGGWEDQVFGFLYVAGGWELRVGWGQPGAQFAQWRFEHKFAPAWLVAHSVLATTPVSFVICPNPHFTEEEKKPKEAG